MIKKKIYRFCPYCATPLKKGFCDHCKRTIYRHTPLTAASIVKGNRNEVLLIKRAGQPFKGKWSLPAGFVNFGENPIKAALRELVEEVGLKAKFEKIVGIYLADDHPDTFSLLTVISTKEVKGKLVALDDAEKAKFFNINKLPPMAFAAQRQALKEFFGHH